LYRHSGRRAAPTPRSENSFLAKASDRRPPSSAMSYAYLFKCAARVALAAPAVFPLTSPIRCASPYPLSRHIPSSPLSFVTPRLGSRASVRRTLSVQADTPELVPQGTSSSAIRAWASPACSCSSLTNASSRHVPARARAPLLGRAGRASALSSLTAAAPCLPAAAGARPDNWGRVWCAHGDARR